MRGRQTKKGRRENARDLGVVEWRTPVGRAERAGDREGKREMQVQTRMLTRERKKRTTEREKMPRERRREPEKGEEKRKAEGTREGVERKQAGKARGGGGGGGDHSSNTRKHERGEEGRERRDQGRYNTQKSGGEGTSIDIGTGGVRGSDERGDRRAEERQKRVQNEGNGTDEGEMDRDRDRTDKRGKCVRWGRKRKISVVSPHHPARAEWSTVCVAWTTGGRVRDGQPSSPFKKKKEEGICNSSLIKIIFRPIIYWKNERGNNRGAHVIFSPFLCYCAYLPPFWAPTETRPRS